jgi:hypothetical protein
MSAQDSAAIDGLLPSLMAGFEDESDFSLSTNILYARTYTQRIFVESSSCQGV